jgi:hypothetical protein
MVRVCRFALHTVTHAPLFCSTIKHFLHQYLEVYLRVNAVNPGGEPVEYPNSIPCSPLSPQRPGNWECNSNRSKWDAEFTSKRPQAVSSTSCMLSENTEQHTNYRSGGCTGENAGTQLRVQLRRAAGYAMDFDRDVG